MENLMTSDEVAEMLHVDPVTVRRLVTKGELAAYRIGSDYRIASSDLTDYLQRQRVPAQAEREAAQNDPFSLFLRWLSDTWRASREERDRFERFTHRARRVLSLAQEEAQRLKHNYVGTEHLLLGLISEQKGIAGKALSNLGVTLDETRREVEAIIGRGDQEFLGEKSLTPRSKRVLERSVIEAKSLQHDYLGTEHILLSLAAEEGGIAAAMLKKLGISPEKVQAEVMYIMNQRLAGSPGDVPSAPEESPPMIDVGEPERLCPGCGTGNLTHFRYCSNCGTQLSAQS